MINFGIVQIELADMFLFNTIFMLSVDSC